MKGGLEAVEVFERVGEWLVKHRPSLENALIAFLNLAANPKAHQRFGMKIDLTHVIEDEVLRCMRVDHVSPCDLAQLALQDDVFKIVVDSREREEAEYIAEDPEHYGVGLILLTVLHKGQAGPSNVVPAAPRKGDTTRRLGTATFHEVALRHSGVRNV